MGKFSGVFLEMYQEYKNTNVNRYVTLTGCQHHLIDDDDVCLLMTVTHVMFLAMYSRGNFNWNGIRTSDDTFIVAEMNLKVCWQVVTYGIS